MCCLAAVMWWREWIVFASDRTIITPELIIHNYLRTPFPVWAAFPDRAGIGPGSWGFWGFWRALNPVVVFFWRDRCWPAALRRLVAFRRKELLEKQVCWLLGCSCPSCSIAPSSGTLHPSVLSAVLRSWATLPRSPLARPPFHSPPFPIPRFYQFHPPSINPAQPSPYHRNHPRRVDNTLQHFAASHSSNLSLHAGRTVQSTVSPCPGFHPA